MRKLYSLALIPLLAVSFKSCDFSNILPSNDPNTKNEGIKYEDDGDYTNDNLKANGPNTLNVMPSTGDVNVLVIPINFNDNNMKDESIADIDKAFNAELIEDGYESVSSYYKKSSYGKLNLSFDIASWYTPKKSMYEYSSNSSQSGASVILKEALTEFDSLYDYNDYDSDKDGFIDSVWMIYNIPYDQSDEFLWAYTGFNYTNEKWDEISSYIFGFASIDFLYNKANEFNTTTFIHETGHMLGLEDYYDYTGKSRPMEGLDMMDLNVGDQSSFSKILLGWVSPKVVTANTVIDLKPFEESGEVILVAKEPITTIYTEYILIDFYTPTGLNSYHSLYESKNKKKAYGIRVLHADASVNLDSNGNIVSNGGEYDCSFKYDNTDGYKKMLKLLKASTEASSSLLETSGFLFTPATKKFGNTIYSRYQMNNGQTMFFEMTVNSLSLESANIEIKFK